MLFGSEDVRIVLVRPRNPLNIAAAARAMRNFGLEDFAVVAPYEPVWQDARAAPGAEELLSSARVVPRLADAIQDRTFILGTSSLARRKPALPVVALDQLSRYGKKWKDPERLAILFGSEKTGLSNKDLSFCAAILRIPTAEECPSMNLGQAVAVCCYELRRLPAPRRSAPPAGSSRASAGEVIRLLEEIEQLLGQEKGPETARARARSVHLRRMFLRWSPTSQDVTLFLGILRDLSRRLRPKP